MSDETRPVGDEAKPVGMWEQTKAWANKNRTISGAVVGGAAGTIVPGLGTLIGAILGAGVGFASSKEREKKEDISGG
jgi:outer membrane lipoprotein SlyB